MADEIEIGEVVVAEVEDLKAAAGEDRHRSGHGAKQSVSRKELALSFLRESSGFRCHLCLLYPL